MWRSKRWRHGLACRWQSSLADRWMCRLTVRLTSKLAVRWEGRLIGRWTAGICCISLLFCQTVWAETEDYIAVDGGQISADRLEDSVIEYEELGSLIHAYNTQVQKMIEDKEEKRKDYTEIRDYLISERHSATDKKEEAEDDGEMEDYADYAVTEAAYQAGIKSYNKMIKKLDSTTSNKTRISLEKRLTNGAQSLMISWQSLSIQKESMKKMEELYRELYENTQTQKSVGLATEQEVLTAYNNWQEMSISLQSLEDSTDSICQNLCLLLGLDESGAVNLQNIPAVDVSKVSELDLENDTKKAVSYNTDIIGEREQSAKGTAAAANKDRKLTELEEKLTRKMKQMYEKVQEAKQSYDAAQTGYNSAKIIWNNAQKQYSMGMLSKAEYLQKEIAYVQKKTNYEAADLSLLQALETYQWAVKGIVDLD